MNIKDLIQKNLFIFFICIFSFIQSTQYSQEKINIKRINYENGLPAFQVKTLAKDQYGYLWIGLEGGLCRYDGKNVFQFEVDPFDSTCLPNPMVNDILCNGDNIWLATDGGLILYSYINSTFTKIELLDGKLNSDWILSICSTEKKEQKCLWLGIPRVGLVKYDLTNGTSNLVSSEDSLFSILSKDIIFKVHADPDNNIWIGTHRSGLFKYDPVSEKYHQYTKDENVNSINDNHILDIESSFNDTSKTLLIGTGAGGLNKFDIGKNNFSHYLYDPFDKTSIGGNRIFTIGLLEDQLILGTYIGAFSLNEINQNIVISNIAGNVKNSFDQKIILSSYVSSSNIFLGTYEDGIYYYKKKPQEFITYSNNENLSSFTVNSIAANNKGDVYVANSDGIDILYKGKKKFVNVKEIPELQKLLSKRIIFSVFSSKKEEGIIWIGTFHNGLLKYNYITNEIKTYNEDPKEKFRFNNDSFNAVFEDSEGDLWFGGITTGLNRLNTKTNNIDQFVFETDDTTSISNNFIISVYEDSENQIWVTTESGLNKYDKKNNNFLRIYFDKENTSSPLNTVNGISEDPKENGVYWIATASGLIKYCEHDFSHKRFTTNNGLSSNLVVAILNDGKEEIWIATAFGLNRLNVVDEQIDDFTGIKGMELKQFSLAASHKDLEGNLYFGGYGKYVKFHPDSIKKRIIINEPVLSNFYLFNKRIAPSKTGALDSSITVKRELVLDYSENIFSFQFSLPNIDEEQEIKFSYILEGFYDEWINASENNIAAFTNVPPGEYTFKVKANNKIGESNAPIRSLSLIIIPPFWNTWWAYLVYIFIFTSSVYGFIEYRSRKLIIEKRKLQRAVDDRTEELKKLNADKDRFFSIVAHDIKSPFVALVKFASIFKKSFKTLSDEEKLESIDEINKTLISSYSYLTNLLNWSRVQIGRFEFHPQEINIIDLISKAIKYVQLNAKEKNITINYNNKKKYFVYADYEMISIVIRNLLSNSIKFTHRNGNIKVRIGKNGDYINICIEDNGIGMDSQQINDLFKIDKVNKTVGTENEEGTGLGLILCNELIKKNDGRISVISRVNQGSKFTVEIPILKTAEVI